MRSVDVASVRLTVEEKEFLERLIAEGKYKSISEALKAGLYELMREHQMNNLPWKNREEVRHYFSTKKRKLRGLEDLHNEEE